MIRSRMIRTGLIWSVGAIAIMLGTIAWVATVLPTGEPIPVHWGLDGPDAHSERRGALITLGILPLAAIITSIVMSLAPALDPFRDNLRTSRKAYTAVWVSLMVLMAVLTVGIGLSMVSQDTQQGQTSELMKRLFLAVIGLMIMVLGNYLPKTRPSFFLGFRTPWTLTSDYTWEKTHRLGGRVMMIAGMCAIAVAFILDDKALLIGFLAPVISAKLFIIGYSWWVWRGADDRNEGTDYIV